MVKRSGLGKGLGALIPDIDTAMDDHPAAGKVINLNIDDIFPNRSQPRTSFSDDELLQLEESIRANGVIQPIIVVKEKLGYQIVAGERRWRASKQAGIETIPAIVRSYDDLTAAKVALIENVQRSDLNAIEEAHAYQVLLNEYKLTQSELSKSIGKSRSYITNLIRLLNLPFEVQKWIIEGKLSFGHGKALLMFSEQDRLKVAKVTMEKGYSVRELEALAKKSQNHKKKPAPKVDYELLVYENTLADALGTKVKIKANENKGKIEIDFYNEEDLQRILQLFK